MRVSVSELEEVAKQWRRVCIVTGLLCSAWRTAQREASSMVRNTDRFRRIMTREQPSAGPQARTVGSGQGDAVAETGTACGRVSISMEGSNYSPKDTTGIKNGSIPH